MNRLNHTMILLVAIVAIGSTNAQKESQSKIVQSPDPQWNLPKGYQVISEMEIIQRFRSKRQKSESTQQFDQFTSIYGMGYASQRPLANIKGIKKHIQNNDIRATWALSVDQRGCEMLVLQDLISDKLSFEGIDMIKKQMAERYGMNSDGEILASWFDGQLNILYHPQESIFGPVAQYEEVLTFQKGVKQSSNLSPNCLGSMVFYTEVMSNGDTIRYANGGWSNASYGFKILEMWLNENYRPQSPDLQGLSWLVTTGSLGKSHLISLDHSSLNDSQRVIVDRVSEIIGDRLPPRMFNFLITTDQRLYCGHFIRADYSNGEGWTLTKMMF